MFYKISFGLLLVPSNKAQKLFEFKADYVEAYCYFVCYNLVSLLKFYGRQLKQIIRL